MNETEAIHQRWVGCDGHTKPQKIECLLSPVIVVFCGRLSSGQLCPSQFPISVFFGFLLTVMTLVTTKTFQSDSGLEGIPGSQKVHESVLMAFRVMEITDKELFASLDRTEEGLETVAKKPWH